MAFKHILFERDDGIARLTLNRPDRLNSFNVAMHQEMVEPFCKLGLIPDTGGTHFLPRLIGHARATGLHSLDQQLDLERDFMRELGYSADYREGVSAFMAKRPPRFTGS